MWTWYYIFLLVLLWFFGIPFALHSLRRYEQYVCYYYELSSYDSGFLMFLASLFLPWLAVIYWELLIVLDSFRFERKERAVVKKEIEDLIRENEKRNR